MDDDTYHYHHLPEIIQQKTARIGGLPFLTVWQFFAMFGVGGFLLALGAPLLLVVMGAAAGFGALYVYNGEFLALRWYAVLQTAVRIRLHHPPVVNLAAAWATVQPQEMKATAVVYPVATGLGVVTDAEV